ncbi:MAG: sulfite exporter TauE/SafE family protein [Clostridia bacterium]|nr:sulfite exporter TauE/SafE family protein [Clostridia bacterium]
MSIFFYIICGILGGILGGMGMGGGTLLIPLLTIFLNVPQKTAQGINLIAFIPMALVAIIIHFKNKLINFNGLLWIIIPGVVFSVSFSFLANKLNNAVLKFLFGNFLILIAVYEIIQLCFDAYQKHKLTEKSKKIKKRCSHF